jgi:hypothetical protein
MYHLLLDLADKGRQRYFIFQKDTGMAAKVTRTMTLPVKIQ